MANLAPQPWGLAPGVPHGAPASVALLRRDKEQSEEAKLKGLPLPAAAAGELCMENMSLFPGEGPVWWPGGALLSLEVGVSQAVRLCCRRRPCHGSRSLTARKRSKSV